MTDLRTAAQALVDRWDTPNWKDAPHTGKYIDALRAALSAPAAPQREWCCEAGWAKARDKAWAARDTNCGCDHIEYCGKCFPVEFRDGGKWRKYAEPDAAPSPQEQTCPKN